MLHVPGPCALDDRVDVLKARLPAKLALDFIRSRDEPRGIARTAWLFHDGDVFPRDPPAAVDDLADAGAAAGAQVVEGARLRAKGEAMGLGEVEDVDVVPDADRKSVV